MYTSTIALAIAPLLLLARADVSLDRDDIPALATPSATPSVDASRPTDASQLTTTIIAGATGTRGSSDPSNTGSSGGSGNSNNNDDASATNSAASPDETNAAAAMAPVAFVGAAVGAAMLLV
ncbi:hypothetical protein FCULG_00007405 [Fusarium culmorum]|uniref:GPI anchored protein n=1 Tax=Fusarium culmorum TaxID=5516 RepID=A0A2T4H3K0_FUSCU|nr:hypothetical protein FCULG_00007405 [Fusarium culmorum]